MKDAISKKRSYGLEHNRISYTFKAREVVLSIVCDILVKFLDVIMFQAFHYICGFDIWRRCNFGAVVFIK